MNSKKNPISIILLTAGVMCAKNPFAGTALLSVGSMPGMAVTAPNWNPVGRVLVDRRACGRAMGFPS